MNSTTLDFPKFTKRQQHLQQQLYDALQPLTQTRLTGEAYSRFLSLIAGCDNDLDSRSLHQHFKHLLDQTIKDSDLFHISGMVAGNITELRSARVVSFGQLPQVAWEMAEIVDVGTVRRNQTLNQMLQFRILTGPLAYQVLTCYWSFKKTSYLATYRNEKNYGFGFSRSQINKKGEELSHYVFFNIHQFFKLRCYLLLDPERDNTVPYVKEIGHGASTMDYNRQLIRQRDRGLTDCLKKLPGNPECHQCPYGQDRCELATHERTYKKGTCKVCGKLSFFDPVNLDRCVSCSAQELKR